MRAVGLALCLAACSASAPGDDGPDALDDGDGDGKGDGVPGTLRLDFGPPPPPGDPIEIRAFTLRGRILRLDVVETGPGCGEDEVSLTWSGGFDPPSRGLPVARLGLRRWERNASCVGPARLRRLRFDLTPIALRAEAAAGVDLDLVGTPLPDLELRPGAVVASLISVDPGEPIHLGTPAAPGDPLGVSYVYRDGDLLHVGGEWRGGCEVHEFRAYWDGAVDAERRVVLTLAHLAHGDDCTRETALDLTVDLRALADLRAAEGSLRLRIAGTPWDVAY